MIFASKRLLASIGFVIGLITSNVHAVSFMGRELILHDNIDHLRNTTEYGKKLADMIKQKRHLIPTRIGLLDHTGFVNEAKQLIDLVSTEAYRAELTNAVGDKIDRTLQFDPYSDIEELFSIRDKIQGMGPKAVLSDIGHQIPFSLTKNTLIGDVLKVVAIPAAISFTGSPILGGVLGDWTGRLFGWALTAFEIGKYKGKNALYLIPTLISRYEKLEESKRFNQEEREMFKAVLKGLEEVSVSLEIPMIDSLTRRYRLDGSQMDLNGVFALQVLKEIERRRSSFLPKSTEIARDRSHDAEAIELEELSNQMKDLVARILGTKSNSKKFKLFIRDFLYPV